MTPRPSTEIDIYRVFSTWKPHFLAHHGHDAEAAAHDYHQALFGQGLSEPADPSLDYNSSLIRIWGAWFRPMASGRTGGELARESGLFERDPAASTLERISQAHGVLADVVAVDAQRGLYSLRSVFDGSIYHVPARPAETNPLHRWMRVLTLLIDRGDGFWSQPSTISASPFSGNVSLQNLWAEVRDRAGRLGLPVPPEDPTPTSLARYFALAHAAFLRQSVPSEEQVRERKKKLFAMNSDGDRVEYQRVALDWRTGDRAALKRASAGGVFRQEGPEWLWVGKGHLPTGHTHETLAELREAEGCWELEANSPQRVVRALEHLSTALGRVPVTLHTDVARPWEQNDKLASEASAETSPIVLSTSFHKDRAAASRSNRQGFLDTIRASLETPLASAGGAPREAVKTPEGKAKVEEWLRGVEARGIPSRDEQMPRLLDLDPIRTELGLPTVASTIPPAPRGDVGLPPARLAPPRPVVSLPGQPLAGGKVGRNDPCPCGSGKKFKKCCGA